MYRPDDIGDSKWVRCGFGDCYQCCLETEMILTREEILRIESNTNYTREEFLLPVKETEGFNQLRNVESEIGLKCFFLSNTGKCTIYDHRPEGCRLYPLILNLETDEVMIDYDCREQDWFRSQEYLPEQIVSIRSLVFSLLQENQEYD